MMSGNVKWYNASEGEGYIAAGDGSEYYFHHSDVDADDEYNEQIEEGDAVEFEVVTECGEPQAVSIRLLRAEQGEEAASEADEGDDASAGIEEDTLMESE